MIAKTASRLTGRRNSSVMSLLASLAVLTSPQMANSYALVMQMVSYGSGTGELLRIIEQ
jgi:hypothetical protein